MSACHTYYHVAFGTGNVNSPTRVGLIHHRLRTESPTASGSSSAVHTLC